MKTIKELREATDPFRARVIGAIRRMTISLTNKALWQLVGFRIAQGDSEDEEVINAEPFTGIGFYARPPSNGKSEAIVSNVQADSEHPVVIAVRDEATRKAIAGAIGLDETMVFNSVAFVHLKANQTVEIRKPSGTAVALALKSDVDEVIAKLNAFIDKYKIHTHLETGGTTNAPGDVAVASSANAAGTTVLKGQ